MPPRLEAKVRTPMPKAPETGGLPSGRKDSPNGSEKPTYGVLRTPGSSLFASGVDAKPKGNDHRETRTPLHRDVKLNVRTGLPKGEGNTRSTTDLYKGTGPVGNQTLDPNGSQIDSEK